MTKPLISVIIPIYNLENYIAQAIDSVLAQSIGFEQKIELILINDGSIDRSGEIAKSYAEKSPNNIRYKKVKNGGVSRARNLGLAMAQGKYIHFFDGDDILSENFYAECVEFLDAHDKVDLVASKLMFFDEIIDSHPLNFKFKSTRIIDLENEPNNPLLHVMSCVFRYEAVRNRKFDETLTIAEDVKFIGEALLKNRKFGVIANTTYHYRKRTGSISAIGGSLKNTDYYKKVPERTYGYLLDVWTEAGVDSSPMEFTVLYDLSYRLTQKSQSVLNNNEETVYAELIKKIASRCSDATILSTKFLNVHQKLYILKTKHQHEFNKHIRLNDTSVYFDGHKLYDFADSLVTIDFLTRQGGDKYLVEGYVDGLVDIPGVGYSVCASKDGVPLKFVSRYQREESFLGDIYNAGGAFEAQINYPTGSDLHFCIKVGESVIKPYIHTGPFTRFGALKWTYRRENDRLLKRSATVIRSLPYSGFSHLQLELRMLLQILLNWRLNTAKAQYRKLRSRNLAHLSIKAKVFEILKPGLFIAEALFYIPRAFLLRTSYYIAKRFKRRPIWLISDRGMAAGDNGEALFRYIAQQSNCPADVFFVISKKSKDYDRIRQIGKVINQDGLYYKLKFLLADKIIASQADVETTNPFIRQQDHYIDLFNFQFVFLQHGIIRHNLSTWLNRFNKNIDLFITSAEREYNSIFTNPYYYEKKNVLLSGLARYDYLENEPAGVLMLAPTYRKNLVHEKTDKAGRRKYDPLFKGSEYQKFYNDLMNDERVLQALKSNNMRGEFYLHPVFSEQRPDFDENDLFKVMEFPYSYKDAFKRANMLISDHSSVVFDFAYLKKPVAYAHFDVETFFEGHSYDKSNFFSDEDDGFGEVYYDYETLIQGVVDTINNGCAMSKKYKDRVDKFFHKVDKNNSKRTYDAILKMDK